MLYIKHWLPVTIEPWRIRWELRVILYYPFRIRVLVPRRREFGLGVDILKIPIAFGPKHASLVSGFSKNKDARLSRITIVHMPGANAHFRMPLRIAAVAFLAAYLARLSSPNSQSCCSPQFIQWSPMRMLVTIMPPTQQVGFHGWRVWVVMAQAPVEFRPRLRIRMRQLLDRRRSVRYHPRHAQPGLEILQSSKARFEPWR